MRDILTFSWKTSLGIRLGTALGALLGLFIFGQAAEAANPLEMNFWLSGPKYEGRLASCEAVLGTITSQFQEKESTFWNSSLQITAYGRVHETAFRPWQSDNIPRRYCSGDVMLSDGKKGFKPAVLLYKGLHRLHLDRIIKEVVLPQAYKARIYRLDMAS